MTSDAADLPAMVESLEALRLEVVRLSDRVATLEAKVGGQPGATAPKRPAPISAAGVSEELVAVISAALAAFLGVRPHIRQISVVGGASWAEQGRVTIQASHALTVRHN